jgi:ERCC4-type nuclease
MAEFTYWQKDGSAPRLYFKPNTQGNAYLTLLNSGVPRLNSSNTFERNQLMHDVSTGHLMHSTYQTFETFIQALQSHGHVVHTRTTRPANPSAYTPVKADYANMTSPAQRYAEAEQLQLGTVKFLHGNKHYLITVDTREPTQLAEILATSNMKIQSEALTVGDIRISHTDNSDELIIERKTISDLYNSIISNHAHRQAEALFEYQNHRASLGHRTQIFWLIEGEEQGARTLYNAFDKIVQTDGVINYFSAILGQGVLQTFNMQHTCYLAIKLAQGFHEQELVYKVNEKARKTTPTPSPNYHGVRGDKNLLLKMLMAIPSIKEPVAHQIIAKGHKMADVFQYTKSQWLSFDGVGTTTADKILLELSQL